MNRVYPAEPYRSSELSSFGTASCMLLRQYEFPDTYDDEQDVLLSADHDRCFMWDYKHARACCDRHLKTGEMVIPFWLTQVGEEEVFAFLKDILKAEEIHPGVKWTGFRVLGTVNRSNGFPVFSLQLFAKHPLTETKVYTGPNAPNVKTIQRTRAHR